MVWTGNLHECGGVLQGWHNRARSGLQGWVYPGGTQGACLNHELVRMRGFDGQHGRWAGEPRTGVCGCDGPALRPAASMPDTRALPYPARLQVRFSVARAFQPEICPLVSGTPANRPLEVQSASNTLCLTRRREGKRTAQRSVAFAGDRVDGCLTRSLALQRMRYRRKRFE